MVVSRERYQSRKDERDILNESVYVLGFDSGFIGSALEFSDGDEIS